MKPGLFSFKGKRTQPPWDNNKNDSDLERFMSRQPKNNRPAGVAIEKVFKL
jgi:hypothetical protein